ncbi:hypothetical protein GCM10011413_00500 [Pedobacter psychrotolerans]|uniref:Uncharacterized protein n=1 Tax=Pedobacter psychrotolerans TaxID=1843235 RepID=A0ABQ1SIR0_9SPHI|nr:hypothetical protein [Pedobacter psychrotolerans]GGE38855.1 hypothetical protein GCM10011413_00500 [Pedobacter psychrotolerans]
MEALHFLAFWRVNKNTFFFGGDPDIAIFGTDYIINKVMLQWFKKAKLFGFEVEDIDSLISTDPKGFRIVLKNFADEVVAQTSGDAFLELERFKIVAIKTAQAVFGTEPHVALIILLNIPDGVGAQTIGYSIMPKENFLSGGIL